LDTTTNLSFSKTGELYNSSVLQPLNLINVP
jgi:hypothetical protein